MQTLLHLKHLSARHEASILKLRFVLQPFSFLFLLSGSGRQDYLKEKHPKFSRIWHDYSDTKKGFITWKSILEDKRISLSLSTGWKIRANQYL